MRETKNKVGMKSTTGKKTDAWKKSQRASQGQQNRKQVATPAKKTTPTQEPPATRNRTFCGGGWDNTGKFGTFINIQVDAEILSNIEPDQYGKINLTIAQRREPDEVSGKTLMVYVKE